MSMLNKKLFSLMVCASAIAMCGCEESFVFPELNLDGTDSFGVGKCMDGDVPVNLGEVCEGDKVCTFYDSEFQCVSPCGQDHNDNDICLADKIVGKCSDVCKEPAGCKYDDELIEVGAQCGDGNQFFKCIKYQAGYTCAYVGFCDEKVTGPDAICSSRGVVGRCGDVCLAASGCEVNGTIVTERNVCDEAGNSICLRHDGSYVCAISCNADIEKDPDDICMNNNTVGPCGKVCVPEVGCGVGGQIIAEGDACDADGKRTCEKVNEEYQCVYTSCADIDRENNTAICVLEDKTGLCNEICPCGAQTCALNEKCEKVESGTVEEDESEYVCKPFACLDNDTVVTENMACSDNTTCLKNGEDYQCLACDNDKNQCGNGYYCAENGSRCESCSGLVLPDEFVPAKDGEACNCDSECESKFCKDHVCLPDDDMTVCSMEYVINKINVSTRCNNENTTVIRAENANSAIKNDINSKCIAFCGDIQLDGNNVNDSFKFTNEGGVYIYGINHGEGYSIIESNAPRRAPLFELSDTASVTLMTNLTFKFDVELNQENDMHAVLFNHLVVNSKSAGSNDLQKIVYNGIVKNIDYTGNDGIGLFGSVVVSDNSDRLIKTDNIYLDRVVFDLTDNPGNKIGGIVGEAQSSITLNSTKIRNLKMNLGSGLKTKVGGLVGETTKQLVVNVPSISDISIELNNDESVKCVSGENDNIHKYIGGLVGDSGANEVSIGIANSSVTLKNITINSGYADYVGGLLGNGKLTVSGYSKLNEGGAISKRDININTITITNARQYAGGLVGSSSNIALNDLNLTDIKVNAHGNYVGGVSGSVDGVVNMIRTDLSKNISVTGDSYLGGVAGSITCSDADNSCLSLSYSKVLSNGAETFVPVNVNIQNVESSKNTCNVEHGMNVGGFAGYMALSDKIATINGLTHTVDSVKSEGSNIGGMVGAFASGNLEFDGYNKNSVTTGITGYANVGGVFGSLGVDGATPANVTINIKKDGFENQIGTITGKNNNIGGFAGFMKLKNDTKSNLTFLGNVVLSVIGLDNVGGLIGHLNSGQLILSGDESASYNGLQFSVLNTIGKTITEQPENSDDPVITKEFGITGDTNVGGVIGLVDETASIGLGSAKVYNRVNFISAKDNVGGFIGSMTVPAQVVDTDPDTVNFNYISNAIGKMELYAPQTGGGNENGGGEGNGTGNEGGSKDGGDSSNAVFGGLIGNLSIADGMTFAINVLDNLVKDIGEGVNLYSLVGNIESNQTNKIVLSNIQDLVNTDYFMHSSQNHSLEIIKFITLSYKLVDGYNCLSYMSMDRFNVHNAPNTASIDKGFILYNDNHYLSGSMLYDIFNGQLYSPTTFWTVNMNGNVTNYYYYLFSIVSGPWFGSYYRANVTNDIGSLYFNNTDANYHKCNQGLFYTDYPKNTVVDTTNSIQYFWNKRDDNDVAFECTEVFGFVIPLFETYNYQYGEITDPAKPWFDSLKKPTPSDPPAPITP